jgi:hypothetical protein
VSHSTSLLLLASSLLLAAPVVPAAGPPVEFKTVVTNDANNPVPVTGQIDVSGPVEVTGQVDVTSAPVTHMGQNVADHVSLVTGSGGSTTCPSGQLAAFRQFADGNFPFEEFVVPEGKTFVITDLAIGIRERAGNDWVAGNNLISFQLGIGPGAVNRLWVASIQIDDLMAQSEEAWFTEHLVSGVAVGPGERVCIRAGFSFSATADTVSLINLSKVYGYLVAN